MRSAAQMVDIHSHLLPGLDDGARTMAESLAMCELYLEQGVTTVVATPHMADSRFDVTPEAVRRGIGQLTEACLERGLDLKVLPGGDVRLQPELLTMLDSGAVLTVGDGGLYLLLELPPQVVPRIEGLVARLHERGVTPVLSHPERNLRLWSKPRLLADLVGCGCLVQVSADSLFGGFGPVARQSAERFLKAGLVHVVAGDAHSSRGYRRPRLRRAAAEVEAIAGQGAVARLLCENPARIVHGQPVPVAPPPEQGARASRGEGR